MNEKRELLPPISGVLQGRTGNRIRFQFVSSGHALPFVIMSNHGLGDEGEFQWVGRPVRFKFLISPAGPDNRWQRTDAAEPVVDFADGSDPVPDAVRTHVHDDCLDVWEAYLDTRPELVPYARLTEINNDIVQLNERADAIQTELAEIHGRRKNLLEMERRIRESLPPQAQPLTAADKEIIEAMVTDNCWLSLREGQEAELHPFNSPDVLKSVNPQSAQRLVISGFVQLHRHLADGRTVFKIAERGRETVEGRR